MQTLFVQQFNTDIISLCENNLKIFGRFSSWQDAVGAAATAAGLQHRQCMPKY